MNNNTVQLLEQILDKFIDSNFDFDSNVATVSLTQMMVSYWLASSGTFIYMQTFAKIKHCKQIKIAFRTFARNLQPLSCELQTKDGMQFANCE